MEQVSNVLFWISNGLLVPVIIGLLVLFISSLLLLGDFFNRYLQRNKQEKVLKPLWKNLNSQNINSLKEWCLSKTDLVLAKTSLSIIEDPFNEPFHDQLIANYELQSEKKLGKAKILTKFGPILGLMGTLIPMGPALVGLSSGDIGSMAHNMQVAFATTVIGLFSGAIGYILLLVEQRWHNADLIKLDYLAALHKATAKKTNCTPAATSLLQTP